MIILQDNKEQTPWNLKFYDGVEDQKKVHLVTGDYTVEGLENIVVIERKRTSGELCLNVGQKSKAFANEFTRLAAFEHKFLICEFSVNDVLSFPINSGIPKRFWPKLKITGKFILSRISQLCQEHEVDLLFCDNREKAEKMAFDILSEIYDKKKTENNT